MGNRLINIHFCLKSKTKIVTPLLLLSLFLGITIVSTNTILPIQTVNAQKVMVNIGGPSTDEVSSRIIGTLLVRGFSNQYNVTMNGKTIPIK